MTIRKITFEMSVIDNATEKEIEEYFDFVLGRVGQIERKNPAYMMHPDLDATRITIERA